MSIEVAKTEAAIDQLLVMLPAATSRVVAAGAEEIQMFARAELTDPLGPLGESIRIQGPDRIGAFSYRAKIGPTLNYGRQRELGGPIDPVNSSVLTAAYRSPGYWTWNGHDVFTPHVFQVGQHYLKRGVEISLPLIARSAHRIWSDMIRSVA